MVLRRKLTLLALCLASATAGAIVTTRQGPTTFDGLLLLPASISASPDLGDCDADHERAIGYARDTDSGGGVLCYCRYTGSGYAWEPANAAHGGCP